MAHGLQLGDFGGNKGLLVSLNEEGFLDVLYLGVEVPQLKFQSSVTRDQTFEELKSEAKNFKGGMA